MGRSVMYALPFPDETFELVRMANLALCIPTHRWGFVLAEVERVLRPGGRLELIDDALFFPSAAAPLIPNKVAPPSTFDSVSDSDGDTVVGLENFNQSPTHSPTSETSHASTASSDYCINTALAEALERDFNTMLHDEYLVDPRFNVGKLLREVFGWEQSTEAHVFHLAVPSRSFFESESRAAVGRNLHQRRSADRDAPHLAKARVLDRALPSRPLLETKRRATVSGNLPERRSANIDVSSDRQARTPRTPEKSMFDLRLLKGDGGDTFSRPPVSPKAARLLVGDRRTTASRMTVPFQPPGLVLLPSTLIPFKPLELEMHASKHMDTLLGCKDALMSFMTNSRDDGLSPLEEERANVIWEYER